MSRLARKVFGLSEREVTFEVRGFRAGRPAAIVTHIEEVGRSFLAGYHAGLETGGGAEGSRLEESLETVTADYRGFAYEGAAMALTLLDALPGRRATLARFLAERGADHVYMAHVGAGWAMAKMPFATRSILRRLDPLLLWLAWDGHGFHDGYFRWPKSVSRQKVPRRVRGYARRAYDQGLGRSLWFVAGADVEHLPSLIASFEPRRQADLWAGLGLASTYAGGVTPEEIESLASSAGEFEFQLGQGSVFAATARHRAGHVPPHTESTCRRLAGLSVTDAALLADETQQDLPQDGAEPDYEIWRQRIVRALESERSPKVASRH